MEATNQIVKKITEFRKDKGLSQKELGERIGLSIRQINYIEDGQRMLKDHELKRFYTEFKNEIPIALKELISAEISETETPLFKSTDTPFVNDKEFAEGQQALLKKYPRDYSIWLLNMAEIAMLRSNTLENYWAVNIISGVNYSVVWDLSYAEEKYLHNFNLFKSSCLRILEEVNNPKNVPQPRNDQMDLDTGIDVYAFYYGNHLGNSLDREDIINKAGLSETILSPENNLIKEYLATWKKFKAESSKYNGRLRFHIPFPEERFDSPPTKHWRLFKDTILRRTGTVLYKPNKDSMGLNMAVLEPQEACRSFFDKEDNIQGYLFLGDTIANHHNQGLDYFEKWFNENFETKENLAKFESAVNSNRDLRYLLTNKNKVSWEL